ncbi:hypothetical protein [Chachezhania sediminis]|uniref:hypothetical protein n=1 Tax=Chachezhania sediminis TaxID=2599291 RepID=UPI001E447851|nr:hypothetical protein [Chachezhania sediminis]
MDSIASPEGIDALAAVADAGVDAVVTSGALDGVPILGIVTGLVRAGRSIGDELFLRKTARFLAGMSSTTPKARRRFVEDLKEMKRVHEFGETVLLILERADDTKKPLIVGRLMAAHVEGGLTYDQAMRLAAMVNRCYMPDLLYLLKFQPGLQGKMEEIADALHFAGLLRKAGSDEGHPSDPESGGTQYELNQYAKLLLKYGLDESRS